MKTKIESQTVAYLAVVAYWLEEARNSTSSPLAADHIDEARAAVAIAIRAAAGSSICTPKDQRDDTGEEMCELCGCPLVPGCGRCQSQVGDVG